MYLRGLVVEYRATWESTFLGDAAAEALVGLVLAPARALSGIAMPPLAPLRWPESGEAAPWIHLWAWTALLFVIAPRTLLWLIETARVARLSWALPLDLEAPYYRRLLAAQGGAGQHVEVAAYAGTLGPRAYERLRELLHDLLGARAEVTQRAAVEYGTEAESLAPAREDACLVLVFALAQTPELEVQVRLLEELRASLRPGQRLLVVVDSAGYLERLGAGEEARARLAERRRAWDRATRETQLAVLHLDLGSAPDDDALVRAGEALWTAGGRRA